MDRTFNWVGSQGNRVQAYGENQHYTAVILITHGVHPFEWELYKKGNNIPIKHGKANTLLAAKSCVHKAIALYCKQ